MCTYKKGCLRHTKRGGVLDKVQNNIPTMNPFTIKKAHTKPKTDYIWVELYEIAVFDLQTSNLILTQPNINVTCFCECVEKSLGGCTPEWSQWFPSEGWREGQGMFILLYCWMFITRMYSHISYIIKDNYVKKIKRIGYTTVVGHEKTL